MSHLNHLVRWDLRRLRSILGIWVVIVIGYTVIVGLRPFAAADASAREALSVADSLLWLTMMLISFALISFVIHAHPTVGTDAFWMTRPIPPRSLLASKLLLIAGTLLLLPAIADSVLLAVYRMPLSTSAGVIAQEVSLRIILVLLLVIGAVLTPNLPRFALLCGSVLIAMAAVVGITAAVMLGRVEDGPPIETATRSAEDPTELVVFDALFIVAAWTMLAMQYRTRLKRLSVAAGAAGVALAFFVASSWPIPFLRQELVVPPWADAAALRVDAATLSANTPNYSFFASERHEWSTVNGAIHIDGLQPGWVADVSLVEASIALPNGQTLQSRSAWRTALGISGMYGHLRDPAAVRDLLGVQLITERAAQQSSPPLPQSLPVLFIVRRDEAAPFSGMRGHYRARININLTQFAVEGALPLRAGATHQNRGYRVAIDRTTAFDNEFAIVAREARATSMWERRPWAGYFFYLRNRERGQAIAVNDFTLSGRFTLLRFLPIGEFSIGSSQSSGFSARGMVLRFPPRYNFDRLDVDDAWLAGAELVIVRRTEEGWVERTVEISDFPVGP